ncbi:phytoene/squalene synthase family protein [Rossellomorea sp. H39__3]
MALDDVFKRFNMDREAFRDMIKGQRMDLAGRRYMKMDDVLDYSYHVASTVGLMLLPILAPGKERELREDGIYLGYALQLTNILRDVGEDLDRGRLYLPQDLLVKHECSVEDLREGRTTEAFRLVWEEMAGMAEHYYSLSMRTIGLYPIYSRAPVKGAALLYKEILNEVRKNGYDVFSKRTLYLVMKRKKSSRRYHKKSFLSHAFRQEALFWVKKNCPEGQSISLYAATLLEGVFCRWSAD